MSAARASWHHVLTQFNVELIGDNGLLAPFGEKFVEKLPAAGSHILLLGNKADTLRLKRVTTRLTDLGFPTAWRAPGHTRSALVALATNVLAAGYAPGRSVAYFDVLSDQTWSGMWLPSVAKLSDPNPTFGQHVISPIAHKRGFIVEFAPNPAVIRVRSNPAKTAVTRPAYGVERHDLIAAGELGDPAIIQPLLAQASAQRLVPYPALFEVENYLTGAEKGTELFALPANLSAAGQASQFDSGTCSVCAATIHGQVCAFCQVRLIGQAVPNKQGVLR